MSAVASRRGPDNSVRVAFVGVMHGAAVANILHFQLTTSSSITQSDLDAWLTTLAGDWKTRFQSQLTPDFTFSYAKAVAYTPGGTELVSTYTPTAWSGTASGGTSDAALSGVISWQSSVYWRGGKPRSYIAIPASFVTSGTNTLSSAARTSLAAAAVGFKNDSNALTQGTITGTTIGFVSFRSGNAERGTPLFFAVTGAIVHPRPGSQRRRLGKWQN